MSRDQPNEIDSEIYCELYFTESSELLAEGNNGNEWKRAVECIYCSLSNTHWNVLLCTGRETIYFIVRLLSLPLFTSHFQQGND